MEEIKENAELCPRCGHKTMKLPDKLNAVSRFRKGALICSPCATDEAIHGDLKTWAID